MIPSVLILLVTIAVTIVGYLVLSHFPVLEIIGVGAGIGGGAVLLVWATCEYYQRRL
jgi:hypothetical protein